MPSLDRTPQGWGDVAEAYDADVSPFLAKYARDAIEATALRPGEQVLDVAAGTGALSLAALERGARVTAIDFAPEMVERLQAKAPDVDAHVMDGQDLRFPDDTFDAAYSNLGLMFFPSPDEGMQEMRRVLRPGGRVGITTWNVPERSEVFRTMFESLEEAAPDLPPPPEPPAVFSLSDAEDLAHRMDRAGFRDVVVRQVTHPWAHPSAEAMWEALVRSNPVMPGILGKVDAAKVQRAFLRRLGAGPVSLGSEAHLATATA